MMQIFAHTNTHTHRERRGKTHKSGPAAAVEYHPQVDQIENVFARLFAVYFVKRVRE